ncbi:hypothetical protein LG299_08765 [Microbacterium lacus]|uniref:hypothetical protein n=1 Tax=Microbacterium lacus TaxID=415217 RepID=UPI00384D1EAF
MTGWWRRNAVALGVLVVVLPATFVTVASQESAQRGGASHDVFVALGESVKYAGATVGPAQAEINDDPAAPRGTRVVAVTVEIDPDPTNPIACLSPQLHEVGGLQRAWNERSVELNRGFDEDITSCSSEESLPYSLRLEYVVPEDATGPFTVDVNSVEGWPDLARLRVEP